MLTGSISFASEAFVYVKKSPSTKLKNLYQKKSKSVLLWYSGAVIRNRGDEMLLEIMAFLRFFSVFLCAVMVLRWRFIDGETVGLRIRGQ